MKFDWKFLLKLGIGIFILYLCIYYWSAVSSFLGSLIAATLPLTAGVIIAYFVNILMSFYERHYFKKSNKTIVAKSRRPVCLTGAFLTLLAIIALLGTLVIPQVVSAATLLIEKLPGAIKTSIDYLETLENIPPEVISALEAIDWSSRINQVFDILTSGVGNIMNVVINTVTSVFSAIFNALLSIMFALYLLLSKDKLKVQIKRLSKAYLPDKIRGRAEYALSVLNSSFHRYFIGQCTEAVILGILCTLGMLILGLPYATMVGPLVAVTALVPIAGAYIGAIVGGFVIFTVSPLQALIFIIFLVILQQLEGNLIYPKVVGSQVGLPAIWVLAAVTIGGGLAGITGMLIGVPLTAAIYRFIKDDLDKREK